MKKVFAFTLLLSIVLVVYSCRLQQYTEALPASIIITMASPGNRTVNNTGRMESIRNTATAVMITCASVKSRYVSRVRWRMQRHGNGFVYYAETSSPWWNDRHVQQ